MVYDILDDVGLSQENLSASAMSFVWNAQVKKNSLLKQLEENKRKAYYKLNANGVLRSSMLQSAYEKLEADCAASIETVKDELLFRVKQLEGGAPSEEYSYPYNPDYTLDASQRYYVVYDYYMAMSDPAVRFALFQADTLAPDYLGVFYATLYDRLRSYAEA